MHQISDLIRHRRSVFPASYSDKAIDKETIEEILQNACWAPTHKKTEPWRFKVFHSLESRQQLSDYLASAYKASTPAEKFSEIQQGKISEKPIQAGCAIAICMQREAAQSLPEWEEIAAVACAVQNMWLTCTAMGLGSYWATPGFFLKANDFLQLEEGERCLGLFYMGHLGEAPIPPSSRSPIETKAKWI